MDRIKYFFDRRIASGTGTLLVWLGILSLVVLSIFAAIMTFGIAGKTGTILVYLESFWTALAVALDPGASTDPGWLNRVFLFLVALFGIFILSTLIGVLTSGITEKLYDLRRGRSLVLEEGHTLILGWSAKIGPVISELVLANLSLKKAKIVVLADIDKIEMEEHIAMVVGKNHTTEIICRSGKHTEIQNIKIVNPSRAKSIIILKETNNPDDTPTIKSILAVKKLIAPKEHVPIITEISDPQNVEAAKSIDPDMSIVRPNELITRLIVQSARQPGLSKVYGEILSFKGHEIYFHKPGLADPMPFGELVQRYRNAIAIGIYKDENKEILCPGYKVIVEPADQVIVIAEDDDQIKFDGGFSRVESISQASPPDPDRPPEHIWILGWHQLGKILLEEFNELLPEKSTITIIFDESYTSLPPQLDDINAKYKLNTITGDTSRKAVISAIDMEKCTHIIVMSYRDTLSPENADDKTLLSIVHLRNMCKEYPKIAITSELINFENKELISGGNEINDFVASEELVSQALVQLSENPKLDSLLTQILTADGPEFHIRKLSRYPKTDTFGELSNVCLSFGEVAVGYRKRNQIIINPEKDTPLGLEEMDAIVVFAEE